MIHMTKFPRTFWVADMLELVERWAWYGFFMLFANYLTGSSDLGGLEFTQSQKGLLMGVGTGILYFLPVLTGAIADRYGYKKVLFLAFCIYVTAFIFMPMFHSFTGVFIMYLYLAVGAALFKPIVSATVSKTTDDSNASVGFGIYYMMVNIGAFIGPMVTLLFKGTSHMIFYASAAVIALNFILLLFYKEPPREEQQEKESLGKALGGIFRNMGGIFKDVKFLIFLLIIAGFWTMYHQLFFTLPVFISQWVDTHVLYDFFAVNIPFISEHYSVSAGVLDPEFITNMDSLCIIIFQVLVSSIVMKMRPLRSMTSGFLVCSIGMALTLFSQNVLYTMAAILIFSFGEMAGSPKITEYIGRSIAPANKKALYIGYSFIPFFIGNIFAGIISGTVYQHLSDKVTMTQQFVAERGYSIADGLSTNAYFNEAASKAGMTPQQLTDYLWQNNHPSNIWLVILAIGIISVIALLLYDLITSRKLKTHE